MRILHVIPSVSPKRGGPSQAVLELAREQETAGLDSVIATTNDDAQDVLDVCCGEEVRYQGVRVRFFPKWMRVPNALREHTISPKFTSWLERNVQTFDVVHVHALFSYLSTTAMRICSIRRVPYIVRPSGLLCQWSLKQGWLKKRLYLALLERRNLNQSAAVEYTSPLELREAQELSLKSASCIIPYGITPFSTVEDAGVRLRTRLGVAADRCVVLYMSRVHPKKGIEALLTAFDSWSNPKKFLVIAGNTDGAYDRMIEEQVRNGPNRDSVLFLGFVQGDEKSLLLQGADVFVLPSFSESFGIAVAEAIAAGTPVITTPGVPLSDFVTEHQFGWVVEPRAESILATLDIVYSKEGDRIRQNVRELGSETVSRTFGWPAVNAQVTALYESIAARQ